jgi:hypothetical protein
MPQLGFKRTDIDPAIEHSNKKKAALIVVRHARRLRRASMHPNSLRAEPCNFSRGAEFSADFVTRQAKERNHQNLPCQLGGPTL